MYGPDSVCIQSMAMDGPDSVCMLSSVSLQGGKMSDRERRGAQDTDDALDELFINCDKHDTEQKSEDVETSENVENVRTVRTVDKVKNEENIVEDAESRRRGSREDLVGEEARRQAEAGRDLQRDVRCTLGSRKISAHAEWEKKIHAMSTSPRGNTRASQASTSQVQLDRSPSLRKVMKRGRGTPTKKLKVEDLKKIFEKTATSSLGLGSVGLQQWDTGRGINFNPATTTGCARQDSENCVSQWDGLSRTRPRQQEVGTWEQASDWTRQACPEPVGPTRDALLEDVIGNQKSDK